MDLNKNINLALCFSEALVIRSNIPVATFTVLHRGGGGVGGGVGDGSSEERERANGKDGRERKRRKG